MKFNVVLGLLAVLSLLAACAPIPAGAPRPGAPVPAVIAPSPQPTPMAAVATAEATPAPTVAQVSAEGAMQSAQQNAPPGWKIYTNPAGFSISYPPNWTVTEPTPPLAGTPVPMLQSTTIEGAEGGVQLDWGSGFGGACYAYTALHISQGQISACHTVRPDGTQVWALEATTIGPQTGVGGFAYTYDAKQASADTVLSVVATLTIDALAEQPVTPSAPGEVIVDNAGPDFWPHGSWYYLDSDQKYGKDCYQALPGLTATADVRPELPQAGSYEVFAWSCGNPHYTQSNHGVIEVHRSANDSAPLEVGFNYQTDGGQWRSLGVYNLEPGAFLNVQSVLSGNVVADAFRFVYRGGQAGAEAPPTPLPSGFLVSNHPPSPQEQMTLGDLAARLGITSSYYEPMTMAETSMTFDDCQAFPRDGCGGTREGMQAIVAYEAMTLTYRVPNDALLVAIDGADMTLNPTYMGQTYPQRVFMTIPGGGSVHYYQEGAWRLLRAADGDVPASDIAVSYDQGKQLMDLAAKYSTLYIPTASGTSIVFYGLGPTVAPTDADRQALLTLADQLAALPR